MDELQQAIAIAETGNSKEAQLRLARYLKRQPDSVEGWMALSRVISDRQKKRVFLKKVLTLDPLHVLARSQLEALEHATVTPDMPTVIETSRPETPAAFASDDQPPVEPSPAAAPVAVAAATPMDAPDVGVDDDEEVDSQENGEPAAAAAPPTIAPIKLDRPAAAAAAQEDGGSTDWLLVGLGGLAIGVGLILIFLLLQYF